ncbi:branched-chain amino acid transport system permease protein [Croceifilum oryzae]|uniref:Branched-chain amino acid transport system permease protein n=1 Tax=Croceifilum oryzae TaxID=1553429 RepID=A0AAJ1TLA4_9BACL|nr:branched-chain amino acid ABC transporter permease [Croceifilum oryzae]MDQ0416715.1 branched-chain amino acid transport system permease protein [Croceifilum oryzae]
MQEILSTLPQVLLDGLTLGAIYAVVALGYTMVYGILELINFAHGEIFMAGAFIGTALLFTFVDIGLALNWLTLILVLLLASLLTGVLGVGIERIAYRPLRKAPKLIPLISAVGISFILQDLVRFIAEYKTGNYIVTGQTVFENKIAIPAFSIGGYDVHASAIKSNTLVVIGIAVLIMIVLDIFVNRTKWGIAMRAVAQDRDTAALMGINVNKVIALTFFIGSAIGGATGVLYAQQYATINPFIGFILGLKAFTAAVLGGIGNIRGAMFGGLLIGLLEVFAAANLGILTGGALGAEYKDVFAFIILILVLIFKPAGLFGQAVKEKV